MIRQNQLNPNNNNKGVVAGLVLQIAAISLKGD
jgi:hypothetical protein